MHESVARIIKESGVTYKLLHHQELGQIHSANDVATALGYELERIAKTLLVKASGENRFFLVIVPISAKVDLKRLAEIVGTRRLQMATEDELKNKLDYPSHGVSPFNDGNVQVFMDSSLLVHETILVGAGVIGEEIELQPHAVQALTNATIVEIAQPVQIEKVR